MLRLNNRGQSGDAKHLNVLKKIGILCKITKNERLFTDLVITSPIVDCSDWECRKCRKTFKSKNGFTKHEKTCNKNKNSPKSKKSSAGVVKTAPVGKNSAVQESTLMRNRAAREDVAGNNPAAQSNVSMASVAPAPASARIQQRTGRHWVPEYLTAQKHGAMRNSPLVQYHPTASRGLAQNYHAAQDQGFRPLDLTCPQQASGLETRDNLSMSSYLPAQESAPMDYNSTTPERTEFLNSNHLAEANGSMRNQSTAQKAEATENTPISFEQAFYQGSYASGMPDNVPEDVYRYARYQSRSSDGNKVLEKNVTSNEEIPLGTIEGYRSIKKYAIQLLWEEYYKEVSKIEDKSKTPEILNRYLELEAVFTLPAPFF